MRLPFWSKSVTIILIARGKKLGDTYSLGATVLAACNALLALLVENVLRTEQAQDRDYNDY